MENSRRIFTENGEQFCFNNEAFRSCIADVAKRNEITQDKLVENLANEIGVTKDAVNNWRYNKTGVSSLEQVQRIAKFLGIDWELLVKKVEGKTMIKLSDRQAESVKRIYDILVWFLEEFKHTDGFSEFWTDISMEGGKPSKMAVFERIEKMERKVQLVLNQEYFYLHDLDIYDMLLEYVNEDLPKAYEGKLEYGYRYETEDEGWISVWQDYEKAMNHLNEIIERIK